MRQDTDQDFATYLLETLAPDLREAGYTATAGDVEDAGHRLLAAAEVVTESGFKAVRPVKDGVW